MDKDGQKFSKKSLQKPIHKEEYIWQKLKLLALEKQYGTLKCEVKFHAGRIVEIRVAEVVTLLRASDPT